MVPSSVVFCFFFPFPFEGNPNQIKLLHLMYMFTFLIAVNKSNLPPLDITKVNWCWKRLFIEHASQHISNIFNLIL